MWNESVCNPLFFVMVHSSALYVKMDLIRASNRLSLTFIETLLLCCYPGVCSLHILRSFYLFSVSNKLPKCLQFFMMDSLFLQFFCFVLIATGLSTPKLSGVICYLARCLLLEMKFHPVSSSRLPADSQTFSMHFIDLC